MPPVSTPSPYPSRQLEPVETLEVAEPIVACDGGAGASSLSLGHPLVYLTMTKAGAVDCPYCGRRFVLKK